MRCPLKLSWRVERYYHPGPVPAGKLTGETGRIGEGISDILHRYDGPLQEEKPFTVKLLGLRLVEDPDG